MATNPSAASGTPNIGVRLPTISIPTFTGKYDEWLPFINTFESLIDINNSLDDVQKLQYLTGALKGQAAETIENLELVSSNYKVAIDLLKKQYHNTRLITQQHIRALFDLPHICKDKPSSLRQLVSSTMTHIRALNTLKVATDNWDPLLIHILTSRLDPITHKEWELTTNPNEMPTLAQLTDYLLKRSQTLESVSMFKLNQADKPISKTITQQKSRSFTTHYSNQHSVCPICSDEHKIYNCQELLEASHEDKHTKLTKARLCYNCLGNNHTVTQCLSTKGCKKCGKRHNTILHKENPNAQFKGRTSQNNPRKVNTSINASINTTRSNTEVLLSTAIVELISPDDARLTCRAFLDTGSQSNFITEAACQNLRLKKERTSILVTGINQGFTHVTHHVTVTVRSRHTNYEQEGQFLVLPKITGLLPSRPVNTTSWKLPTNITLADPNFDEPGKIDILLGQEYFFQLLESGQVKEPNMPILQNTKLGWIVGGGSSQPTTKTQCHLNVMERIDLQLQKFWNVEEPPSRGILRQEEQLCEESYTKNVTRSSNGRYTVSMPFKGDPKELGETRETSIKRFYQVERRFRRQPEIREEYVQFMREYIDLGHMTKSKTCDDQVPDYYLPHHPVLKEASTTTKLRVVFDASAKGSNDTSLNDILMTGPTIQDDLFSIIIRFRTHPIVLTADIEKMYRQIWIEPSQRTLLKVIWRENPKQPVQTYKLNTVTYGTSCAPYLATKTLQRLALDEAKTYPEASQVLLKDFYVDDVLTGANNLADSIKLQDQLTQLLSSGGFNLRKWNSNSKELLQRLPSNMKANPTRELPIDADVTTKTLGLFWNSERDNLKLKHDSIITMDSQITKRTILSEISKLFDPLGLVSPIIIRAKVLMQELWKHHYNWDDQLPVELRTRWQSFQECLINVNKININRGVTIPESGGTIEIHGFSDASERAYGAAVYIKHLIPNGATKTSLLCSKSKVAPLKTISLPRLELCAALLLAELVAHVQKALKDKVKNVFFWTDSTIVLSWISADAATWKTFVANRVSKIHDLTHAQQWRHVRSEDNPADLVSRGTRANDLLHSNMWWEGPRWLSKDAKTWPTDLYTPNNEVQLERKQQVYSAPLRTSIPNETQNIMNGFSSLVKLQRVIAYCIRFKNHCTSPLRKLTGPLSPNELNSALDIFIKAEQKEHFSHEISQLKLKESITKGSKLIPLAPFIDDNGIVRVGGRLTHTSIEYDIKHPIILPAKSYLTELIAKHEHARHLHAGPQLLLAAMRQRFWLINGRNVCRAIVHKCVTCFKAKPKSSQPEMGNLPKHRVTAARAFSNVGVDYCGPILIRSGKYRNSSLMKGYVAIFVCFSTKAIHLELVTDMTTDAFLSAFRRFISRRGVCSHIYSDNGTNFVGAKRELKELYNLFKTKEHQQKVADSTSIQNVVWHFIPPNSPHFGGLWEAGVKSLKYHLHRTTRDAHLTYEQCYTTLTMVEACLNSRPITPLSTDPNDPKPLTPGHFLTGEALTSLPDIDLTTSPINRLSHWQRCQQLIQHFWKRWSREYLTQLQQRKKWKTRVPDLQLGQLVLVKDDNLPPLKWVSAIVHELHPGADGQVRVATVKTSSGLLKRSVHRLCVLPVDTTKTMTAVNSSQNLVN